MVGTILNFQKRSYVQGDVGPDRWGGRTSQAKGSAGTCLCVQRTVSVSEVNGEGKDWQGAQVLAQPL